MNWLEMPNSIVYSNRCIKISRNKIFEWLVDEGMLMVNYEPDKYYIN